MNPNAGGLALLRIVTGAIFTAHGCMKLFQMGLPAVTGFFSQVGAPLPALTAPAVAFLEFGGGIALLLGLFTRPLALLFALDMLGAIVLVKARGGFFAPDGVEFELLLGAAAAALGLAGGGAPSLDGWLAARRARSTTGGRRARGCREVLQGQVAIQPDRGERTRGGCQDHLLER